MGTRGKQSLPAKTITSKKVDYAHLGTSSIGVKRLGIELTILRKAIFVAMADEIPFSQIKRETYSKLVSHYEQYGFTTFFVYGRKQNDLERRLRRNIEKLRWNKVHPLLRFYDFLVLGIYKWYRPKSNIVGQDIFVNVPEDIRHLSTKILSALFHLSDLGYDLVIRTTVSSVLIPEVLNRNIQENDTEGVVYGGRINRQKDGLIFASGSLTVLNRKCIDLIRMNARKLDFSLIDDVAIGKLLLKSGITPSIELKTIDIAHENSISDLDSALEFAQVRCKTSGTAIERRDVYLIHKVIEQLGI
jgi:hypothetical protein